MVTLPYPASQPECPGELACRLFLDVWSVDSIKAVSGGLLLPIGPLPLSVKILGTSLLVIATCLFHHQQVLMEEVIETPNPKKRRINPRQHLTTKSYTVHEIVYCVNAT